MKPEISFMIDQYGFTVTLYGQNIIMPLRFSPKELELNTDLKSLLTLMKLKCENALKSLED